MDKNIFNFPLGMPYVPNGEILINGSLFPTSLKHMILNINELGNRSLI